MRINITGFNGAQFGKATANRKGVLNFSELIKQILTDAGHTADFNLENEDLNLVFVIDPSSINAAFVEHSAKILRNRPSVIVFDDWNIKGLYKTIDNIVNEGKFSKTHPINKYSMIMEYTDVWKKIANGEYKVLYPAHNAGNHDLLEIRGEKYFVDPSIYMADYRKFDDNHINERPFTDLLPVHASLANKWQELSKKKYSFINLKNVKEDEVFEYYSRYRMVMSPVHYHDGSGWFRGRYIMAATANAIIVDDQDSIFGEEFSVDPRKVNKNNIDKILESQKEKLYNVLMTKEEIQDKMNKFLESL